MWRISCVAVLALAGAACDGGGADGAGKFASESSAYAPAPAPQAMGYAAAPPADMAERQFNQDSPGGSGEQPATPPGQMMAYSYAWTFAAPTAKMEGLLNAHRKLCEDAGPARCYVVNSGITGLGREAAYGSLSLRASEDWVRTFEGGVEEGLKPFEAKLDSTSRSGEDLTVRIVDGEARLNSMKTMRDRLQELLRDRPGRLSDLLEIERELARVQADIDARESVLTALKQRVAMSTLTLSYEPLYTAASESIWRPLGNAFSNFLPNFAQALAGIVEFVGEALPAIIFLALLAWAAVAFLRWILGRRKRKAAPVPARTTGTTPSAGP